ncbi:hypothetical protein V8E53_003094 [Lactarius tabidus]
MRSPLDAITRNTSTLSPLQLERECNGNIPTNNEQNIPHPDNHAVTPPNMDAVPTTLESPRPNKEPVVETTKNKNKKLMRPTASNTARNLYAIDYLKENSVTCEEFAVVWKELAPSILNTYKQREIEAKKAAKLAAKAG